MKTHCKFCGQEGKVLRSHVFPKAAYAPLKKDAGHFIGINGVGSKGFKKLQDGLWEHLFCAQCEGFFSKHYEDPFLSLWYPGGKSIIQGQWFSTTEVSMSVDYASFKLFHLLNMYRASVSSLPTYQNVALGPHEVRMAEMIRKKDPGPESLYAVSGAVIYDMRRNDIPEVMFAPQRLRHDGRTGYGYLLGNVYWTIAVSEHFGPFTRKRALKEDGSLKLFAMPLQRMTVIHEAMELLARAEAT